ncbi:AMP-binding enzyme [seawater metagenome]|uniref:AMP-binding enzyme n=1 Tax=seawater metagenome TaxID=1561972 RepID=A0A5E8CL41_9ZZZZ
MTKNLARLFYNSLEKNNLQSILSNKINNNWKYTNRDQLNNMINDCCFKLKEYNIQRGDRIAYKGKNSVEWVAWNLACYSMGAIWVPMYNDQNIDQCKFIINDCQPKVFISDTKLDVLKLNQLSSEINTCSNTDFSHKSWNDDLATLIYTSGTTGNPKGVKLSHNNIISNLDSIHNRFGDIKNTTSLNILPWAHIYSLTCELYYNLLNDNLTYLCSGKENFMNECREVKPQVLYIVPKLLELVKKKIEFLDKPLIKIVLPILINLLFGNNLKNIFTGGAKLDDNTKKFYLKNNIIICEGYGCTETSPMVSVNHLYEPRNDETVGKLLDKIIVKIIDGEICVNGPNVMQGYWNNEVATKKAFIFEDNKKWYKTGDSGKIENGFLTCQGRISENYKLNNGKFVNVAQVENIVRKYLKCNFVVFGENQDSNSIVADETIESEVLKKINSELDNYLKIEHVYYIDSSKMMEFLTPKLSIKRKKLINYVITNIIF